LLNPRPIVGDTSATTWGCNQPKLCVFPFSWQPILSSTIYTACTNNGISGTLSYYWCSKKSVYKTGDDYVTCSCANVLANPSPFALDLCTGARPGPQGVVYGFYTSAGVLSQDCKTSLPCSAIRSNWTGTYTSCTTVQCAGGTNFVAQNDSLTKCSAAAAPPPSATLLAVAGAWGALWLLHGASR
jgi:hypothetical protein